MSRELDGYTKAGWDRDEGILSGIEATGRPQLLSSLRHAEQYPPFSDQGRPSIKDVLMDSSASGNQKPNENKKATLTTGLRTGVGKPFRKGVGHLSRIITGLKAIRELLYVCGDYKSSATFAVGAM